MLYSSYGSRQVIDYCSWPLWDTGHPGLSAYLTRRVDYFSREVLTSVLDDFAEGVLNRRVVALHKVSVHELHRQRGFACMNQFPSGRVQLRCSSPTDRLPTMAIFRCFGGTGIAAIVRPPLRVFWSFACSLGKAFGRSSDRERSSPDGQLRKLQLDFSTR